MYITQRLAISLRELLAIFDEQGAPEDDTALKEARLVLEEYDQKKNSE